MSKFNDGLGAFGKIVTWILVILLVVGAVGFATYFIARQQGVNFSVVYGDKTYFANVEGGSIWLPPGKTSEFTVQSLLGEDVNYDVRVQANPTNDFMFEVGGELHSFCDETDNKNDYTSMFGVVKSADGFKISAPNATVEQLIKQQYGGEIVAEKPLDPDLCYFTVIISAEESEVNLWFNFTRLSVTLDPPSIAF